MLLACFSINLSSQSIQQKADSLLALIENTEIDTVKANHYISLGKMYLYNNPTEATQFLRKGLAISDKARFHKGLRVFYVNLFNVHDILGSHSDSLLVYIKAIEDLYEETGDIMYKIQVHWSRGVYYKKFGNSDKVIEEYLKALKLVRQHNSDKLKEAKLLCNIANILIVNGDYEDALDYYKKATPLFVNDKRSQAIVYLNIGNIYNHDLNERDTALQFLSTAYILAEEVEDYNLMVDILIEQGNISDSKENYEQANQLYQRALKIVTQYNLGHNFIQVLTALGRHHLERKQYKRSIEYNERAINLIEKGQNYGYLKEVYENQEKAYVALGNYKSAHEVKTQLANHLDSLNSAEVKGKIKELQTKYEVEQKEAENELLKEKQAVSLRQLRYKSYMTIGLVVALLFAIIWVVTYYRSNQQLRANKEIIESQSRELKELYEDKSRLFVNIAHELRTPLMLITNPINNVMKNKELPTKALQSLQVVHRNTTYLKELVNQVLDLSKSEQQNLPVYISSFQLSDMLNVLITDFQSFADYQKIQFQTPIHIDNISLKTDGEKLFIILKNLLSNAFKYTPSGGKVELNYTESGNDVIINVKDTGQGIDKMDIPHIFKPYFQSSYTPIEGGTGIGLAICKEYIEELGGNIKVNSNLGQGSTFSIQFPKHLRSKHAEIAHTPLSFLEKAAVQPIEIASPHNIDEDRKTLLIVEDNLEISQYLQTILQDNYQILLANNGAEGLKQLEQQQTDLILTDIMMPVMNGFELMKRVKTNEKWQQIPIIALTARNEIADKLEALRIGIDDYLVKPFHEEELQIRIKNLLKYQENRLNFIAEEVEKTEAANMQSDNSINPAAATPPITKIDQEWLAELEQLTYKGITNVDFNAYQLSLEMDISYSQLYRKIKQLVGFTPKQYINQIRYQQARQFLENRTYTSVKRVAYEIGFKDEKNFSRNFKKRFGKYPSAYLE